jgi:uncharacterized protein
MIKRDITKRIKNLATQYGVLSITGPRQSGKTTLVKKLFPKHKYVNFENLTLLEYIKKDPLAFINEVHDGVIIDEVQKYPEILSYIQVSIDENFQAGKFILTGSQNLLLLNKGSQSLAGRVAIIKLLPLSQNELSKTEFKSESYLDLVYKGFYPAIYARQLNISEFYEGYLNTYIERDVRTIQNIGDLSLFTRFLQLLAARVGQLLNLSDIGNSLGVSHHTINSWISILEASYIVFLLEPYFVNKGKRLIKSPKLYFYDTGLVSKLLGINSVHELSNYYGVGNIFENFIIADFYKNLHNNGIFTKLYFYRDSVGNEVDLVLDKGLKLIPIEIKISQSFNSDFFKRLDYFKKIYEDSTDGHVVYTGQEGWQTRLINYKDLKKIEL